MVLLRILPVNRTLWRSVANVKLNTLKENVEYFRNIFGLSKKATTELLTENPGIYLTNKDDLEDSLRTLRRLGVDARNLFRFPSILNHKATILENRYRSLEESGVNDIDLEMLFKYLYFMNRSVYLLKVYGVISENMDVGQRLRDILKSSNDNTMTINHHESLLKNRENLLHLFFKQRLNMNDNEAAQFKSTHILKIRHKSFGQIIKCLELLEQEFRFDHKKIIEHPFLLTADPNNMEKLLFEVKTIFGHDVREIAATRPIFLMTNWKSIIEIIQILQQFDISSSSIHYVLTLFALEPETVSQRLDELESVEELSVLREHPQILRLIYYQNKALHRLGYLKQMKVKCPSINVLSGHTEIFEKFVRSASDGSKSRQIIFFLSKLLDVSEDELRKRLNKHPNWAHTSILSLKDTVEFLFNTGYTKRDLEENIIITFYPRYRIEHKLKSISDGIVFKNNMKYLGDKVAMNKMLPLCLYLIEQEYHFSGDGIWIDPQKQE